MQEDETACTCMACTHWNKIEKDLINRAAEAKLKGMRSHSLVYQMVLAVGNPFVCRMIKTVTANNEEEYQRGLTNIMDIYEGFMALLTITIVQSSGTSLECRKLLLDTFKDATTVAFNDARLRLEESEPRLQERIARESQTSHTGKPH